MTRTITAPPATGTDTAIDVAARADAIIAELEDRESAAVLAQLALRFDRSRGLHPLERVMSTWQLSHADVGEMFSLSRQAIAKWLQAGVPAARQPMVADLDAATDLLERYLKPERIAAVVRRPARGLGERSLLDLALAGDTAAVLVGCRAMFDFGAAGNLGA